MELSSIISKKINRLKAGEFVITNDDELNDIFSVSPDFSETIRSHHNPFRCGVLDKYVAWVGEHKTLEEVTNWLISGSLFQEK